MLLVLLLLLVHFLLVRYSLRAIIIIMHVYPRLFLLLYNIVVYFHSQKHKEARKQGKSSKDFLALILKLLQISMRSTGVSVCHDKNIIHVQW